MENNFTEVCFITAPKMSAIGLNWLCPKYFLGFLFANRNSKIKICSVLLILTNISRWNQDMVFKKALDDLTKSCISCGPQKETMWNF